MNNPARLRRDEKNLSRSFAALHRLSPNRGNSFALPSPSRSWRWKWWGTAQYVNVPGRCSRLRTPSQITGDLKGGGISFLVEMPIRCLYQLKKRLISQVLVQKLKLLSENSQSNSGAAIKAGTYPSFSVHQPHCGPHDCPFASSESHRISCCDVLGSRSGRIPAGTRLNNEESRHPRGSLGSTVRILGISVAVS
jgi:hypothetical protein